MPQVFPHPDGTPDALLPIAEEVLSWVVKQRRHLKSRYGWMKKDWPDAYESAFHEREATIRSIELCALATIESCMFHRMYGGSHGPPPSPQG